MSAVHKVKVPTTIAATTLTPKQTIQEIYRRLVRAWGPQNWWPAESPFEVILGAILTQNTSWRNVERALTNLRDAGLLNVEGIRQVPHPKLEELIRSSGYFRQKAQRLKNFVAYLDARYSGSLEYMFATSTEKLREQLLAQKGIGPETADAILLYSGHHEAFVVDAYARRILERHQAIAANTKYDELRNLFEQALREEEFGGTPEIELSPSRPVAHAPTQMSTATRTAMAQIYSEMHGLIVQVGKHYCYRTNPNCDNCPLGAMLTVEARRKLTTSKETPTVARQPLKKSGEQPL